MSVVLEFSVATDQFRLGDVLSGPPDMRVEVERVVPTGDAVMPCLWVEGDDYASFEENVRDSGDVADLVALDDVDGGVLYRITWHTDPRDIIRGITVAEGTILEAYNEGDWQFHVRFHDHDRLSQFHNYCTEHDIDVHIVRTYTLTDRTASVDRFGLSNEQREALVLGLQNGYFDTPSRVGLDELADELGVSQQAVSNRVRRGTKRVLAEALLSTTDTD